MVFSSAVFLFYYLPLVLIFCYLSRRSIVLQNLVLFCASIIFYFWGEKQYTVLVLASVCFNYMMGIGIAGTQGRLKLSLLWAAIITNLATLIYYKYFGFLVSNIDWLAASPQLRAKAASIHLPLGISFFTFHGLTYVIDIYRRDARVSHNILNTGLYTLFFPQLIAGPIVRYKDIDKQLNERTVTQDRLYTGVKRFIIGFAKKLLIANSAGTVADAIYALDPKNMGVHLLWVAALAYAIQIYFDFSGYSDMAIGLAKMFGFDFLENFNFPYAASSIKDFWRRWHISLSNFFRDYVYIPLGGNKKGKLRTYLNLIVVFFLTGIWHGASWNFVVWGLYHGFFLVLERLGLERLLDKLPKPVRHFYALLVVLVGWVLFRIEDFKLLKIILRKMFLIDRGFQFVYSVRYFLPNDTIVMMALGIIFSFPVHHYFSKKTATVPTGYRLISDLGYLCIFVISLSAMASSTFNPFIYFRF